MDRRVAAGAAMLACVVEIAIVVTVAGSTAGPRATLPVQTPNPCPASSTQTPAGLNVAVLTPTSTPPFDPGAIPPVRFAPTPASGMPRATPFAGGVATVT